MHPIDVNVQITKLGKITKEQSHENLFKFPRLNVRNYVFRNNGDLHFKEMGEKWGFSENGVTHGMVAADLDNDGDLDLVTNNLDKPVSAFRNECGEPRVAVRLRGAGGNTQGIGASVELVGTSVAQRLEF